MRAVCVAIAILGAAAAAAPGAWAAGDPAWFSYDRPAKFSSVPSYVEVPMRDGQALACFLWRPGTGTPGQEDPGGTPAPGKFPGIVDDYTGYADLVAAPTGDAFVTRGYNVINCYDRGQGLSQLTAPGYVYRSPYSAQEAQDNYDLVEWLAAQPFSDGRIGQTGASYGGITSDRVAALQPPHLLTVLPVSSTASEYDTSRYRGGIFTTSGPSWAAAGAALSAGGVNPALVIADYKAHPLFDSYWQQADLKTKFSQIAVPDLDLGGFGDTDLTDGAFRLYAGLRRNAHAPDGGPYLLQGPWGHAGTPSESGWQLAWFDHWLKRLPTAPLPPARVEVYQLPDPIGHGWQMFSDWPPPDVTAERFAFTRHAALSPAAGRSGTSTYQVGPADNASIGAGHSVTFTSSPLKHDLVAAGAPIVHLRASLTGDDGFFVVQLYDVAPDGTSTAASALPWYLRASHRRSNEYLTPVMPGHWAGYTITGWNLSWVFAKGHRLALRVTSGDSNLAESAPSGDVNIATGTGGSFLQLPVRPAG